MLIFTANRTTQDLREQGGKLLPAGNVHAEPVIFACVLRWAITQNSRDCRANVLRCHPADSVLAPEDREAVTFDPCQLAQVLHENVRVQVGPGDPRCFDVRLDKLMPGDVRIRAVPRTKRAQVNNVLHRRLPRRVHERLALSEHSNGVTGQQKHAIYTAQRLRKRGRDGLDPGGQPRVLPFAKLQPVSSERAVILTLSSSG